MAASFAALQAAAHPGCLGAPNVLVDGAGVMTSGPEACEQAQRGPIALLLHSLAKCNLQADLNWVLHDASGSVVMALLEHPWQQ
eukprot:9631084-Alexandrium_andersonii.AAC.1